MFAFRLTEKIPIWGPTNVTHYRYFTILGKVIDTTFMEAQLFLLSNKNFNFDQSIQLKNDGIYYLILDKLSLPDYITSLDIFQENMYFQETIPANSTPSSIHTPLANNNTIIPELNEFILRLHKEKDKTNYMFTNFCMLNTDFIFRKLDNTVNNYVDFPNKSIYIGVDYLPSDYNLPIKIFYPSMFLRKMSEKFIAYSSNIFLPMNTSYFEFYKYTVQNDDVIFEKIVNISPKTNKYYVCSNVVSEPECCISDFDNLPSALEALDISPTEEGHVGTTFTIVITTGKVTITQRPLFSTKQENKIIDVNKEPFTSTGFISSIKSRNTNVVYNIDNLFMSKEI